MERYKCRFCLKIFISGKALDAHMRYHSLSAKRELYDLSGKEKVERPSQLSDESDTSSSSSGEEEVHVNSGDFAEESETESSRINPTRRRSKRTRKLGSFDFDFTKLKTSKSSESVIEPEHQSSASGTTTEEDVAFCLIMLSKDKGKQEEDETDHDCEDYKSSKNRGGKGRGRFKCETCRKEFKSYQALGGHRASHKKNKAFTTKTEQVKTEYVATEKKTHECPICFRVFSSGQALGGHKRSHGNSIRRGLSVNQVVRVNKEEVAVKQRMIDLNLPASTEDYETSLCCSMNGDEIESISTLEMVLEQLQQGAHKKVVKKNLMIKNVKRRYKVREREESYVI